MRETFKISYHWNHCIDHNQILHSDKDHQVSFMGGQNVTQTNLRWRTAAILKNRKIAIYPQQVDRFWQNLACWCIFTLRTPLADKISGFKTIWRMAAILKIVKSWSLKPFDRFWWNVVRWCSLASQAQRGEKIFWNQIWRTANSLKMKIRHLPF